MRIIGARVYRLTLPFRGSYRHHLAERSENESIVLCLRSEKGLRGLGECIPRDYLTGETAGGVEEYLCSPALGDLLNRDFASWEELRGVLTARGDEAERTGRLAAFAALEVAAIDLWARGAGLPVARVLGGVRRRSFEYSGPISAGSGWKTRLRAVMFRGFGFRQIKVKVGFPGDVAALRTVRRIVGPRADIRVDANCAWQREEALERLREMAAYGISCAEQPLPAPDLAGLAWLAERSPVPLMADESLTGLESARKLLALGVPVMFNVRLAKCGGLLRSLALVEMARAAGTGWQLGCLVGETGILAMAGRHFAAATGDYRYLEGSYGPYFLRRDVVRTRVGFGRRGLAELPELPGLGLELDRGAIRRFCRQAAETEIRCPPG